MVRYCFERLERKYLLNENQLSLVLEGIKENMKPDEYGKYTIYNIYYDTDDWQLIRDSVEKPVYKEKLRVRSYGPPAPGSNVYIELKKKFGGIVYKRRISVPESELPDFLSGGNGGDSQIAHEIDRFRSFYGAKPKVFIAYERLAFAGIEDSDVRLTLDSNIRFRTDHLSLDTGYGDEIIPRGTTLMEIKLPGVCPIWLCRLLSKARAYPISFSKYGKCYTEHILTEAKEPVLSC